MRFGFEPAIASQPKKKERDRHQGKRMADDPWAFVTAAHFCD